MSSELVQSIPIAGSTVPTIGRPERAVLVAPFPPTRGPMLGGAAAIAIFFGGFLGWSTFAPLSRAAVAPGVIQAAGMRRTIQHLEGGIVREIPVKDGNFVHKGQILMRLDDIASDSTTASLRALRWTMMAQVARAQAELAGASSVEFPVELQTSAETDAYALEAMQGQITLFRARSASLQGQIQVLALRAQETASQIHAADGQLASLQRQLQLIEAETADVNGLLRSGLETKPHLYALQRTAAQIIGNKNEALAEKARAQTQMSEAYAQIASLRNQRMQDASSELRDANAKLVEATERLRAAADVSRRRAIVAPDDGTIMNLRFNTIGAVVRPGEIVMEEEPADEGLIADVRIQAHDVNDVHQGMSAEVRFPAFNSRMTPYLEGTVTYVAPDATQDDKLHMSYYQAKVHLTQHQLDRLPQGENVIPGMPVQVEITAGKRSLLQYLLQPLRNSFSRAFREN